MASACPRLAEQPGPPRLADNAAKRLPVRYINVLALELASLDAGGQAAAARAALELLRAAIEPALPDSRYAVRAAMRDEIRRYIRFNLADRSQHHALTSGRCGWRGRDSEGADGIECARAIVAGPRTRGGFDPLPSGYEALNRGQAGAVLQGFSDFR